MNRTTLVLFCVLLVYVTLVSMDKSSSRPSSATVRVSNMSQPMEKDAISITDKAFEKYHGYSKTSRSSIAQYIRHQFDQRHGPSWQCLLGLDYALSISSANQRRILLDVGKVTVLIFQGKC